MPQTTSHFFTDAYGPTPTSFYSSNFQGLERCVTLSGCPRAVLQALLSAMCMQAARRQTPVEIIHSGLDNTLQGVLFPQLSAGVFGFPISSRQSLPYSALQYTKDLPLLEEALANAKETFRQARIFHDREEEIYIAHTDFEGVNRLTEDTISALMGGKSGGRAGGETHRFFGAATIDGSLDYIPELTADIPHRYFIKGRPGTGKSTFLKKIAAAARRRGMSVVVYHCALAPDSLDMIVIPQLEACLLDSTAPHEYFPSREGDEIIDIYAQCVKPGTDETYCRQIAALEGEYKALVKKATGFLQQAEQALSRWEKDLSPADPARLARAEQVLIEEIFE